MAPLRASDIRVLGVCTVCVLGTLLGWAGLAGSVLGDEVKISASDASADDRFGDSVCISGETIIVGASGDSIYGTSSGSAYIFVGNGGSSTQQAKLIPSDGLDHASFGWSVSISGEYAIIGAYWDRQDGVHLGSAYVFERQGDTWAQQAKLIASDAADKGKFGHSVAISGHRAIVGAYKHQDAGMYTGSAYVFVRNEQGWSQEAKLIADDAAQSDWFGYSVAMAGDCAVVGAPWDDDRGRESGSAYVFVRQGETWTQQAKLTPSDGARWDNFGCSVCIGADRIIVGADGAKESSGSAYVFVRSGQTWSEQAKLVASDGAKNDRFGNAVSISEQKALIGAYGDADAGIYTGSAYVFVQSGGTWTHHAKLTASDGAGWDQFGSSVSIEGDWAIVGSHLDDDAGEFSGSAYIYCLLLSGAPQTCAGLVPPQTVLAQNAPNPFNAWTKIPFELAQSSDVELSIYNTAGQHVATLLSGHRDAGRYNALWYAGALGSGVYLCRLKVGVSQATRRMVLLE